MRQPEPENTPVMKMSSVVDGLQRWQQNGPKSSTVEATIHAIARNRATKTSYAEKISDSASCLLSYSEWVDVGTWIFPSTCHTHPWSFSTAWTCWKVWNCSCRNDGLWCIDGGLLCAFEDCLKDSQISHLPVSLTHLVAWLMDGPVVGHQSNDQHASADKQQYPWYHLREDLVQNRFSMQNIPGGRWIA